MLISDIFGPTGRAINTALGSVIYCNLMKFNVVVDDVSYKINLIRGAHSSRTRKIGYQSLLLISIFVIQINILQ